MGGFGAFCPFPIPLGGDDVEGWRSTQHARMAADVLAMSRAMPIAKISISRASVVDSEPLLTANRSRPATVQENDPALSGASTSPSIEPVVVTWPVAPLDELGDALPLNITSARFSRHNSTGKARVDLLTPNSVQITPEDADELSGTLTIFGTWGEYSVEKYGGDPDKTDSITETTPYAWVWYQELGASYGDAFGSAMSGSVHAAKLAHARGLAAVMRSEDRRRANSTPSTADVMLESWAKALRVQVGENDPRWLVRRRGAAMFAASSGQNIPDLELAIYDLLGPKFVGIRWFGVEQPHGPWPPSYDLGGGVWATDRARILVDVVPPADANDREFRRLTRVQLVSLLDRLVPATTVFDWTSINPAGFRVGISRLGIDGL